MMKPTPQEIRRASQLFKSLSHPERLRIACRLLEGESPSQKQLVEELGLPQSTVARLLEPLRRAGLVVGLRQGTEVRFSARPEVLAALLQTVCDWFQRQAAAASAEAAEAAEAALQAPDAPASTDHADQGSRL